MIVNLTAHFLMCFQISYLKQRSLLIRHSFDKLKYFVCAETVRDKRRLSNNQLIFGLAAVPPS